jgi:hypothetical protein
MGAADDRVSELLDRWLASVELHARYLALDDAAYAKVQDWPRHQRPTRWIIDLARSRCLELKRHLAERGSRGDEGFADALELMAFLTSLLGSEHVERFIPLAVEGKARPTVAAPSPPPPAEPKPVASPPHPPSPSPSPSPSPEPAARRAAPATSAAATSPSTGRSERSPSPRAAATKSRSSETRSSAARNPPRAAPQPRPARRPETPAPARTAERKPPAPAPAKGKAGGHDPATRTVIADAVRLLNWGNHWPQLASLIARLADRPAEPEVWTILRAHRAEIEAQAKPPSD